MVIPNKTASVISTCGKIHAIYPHERHAWKLSLRVNWVSRKNRCEYFHQWGIENSQFVCLKKYYLKFWQAYILVCRICTRDPPGNIVRCSDCVSRLFVELQDNGRSLVATLLMKHLMKANEKLVIFIEKPIWKLHGEA